MTIIGIDPGKGGALAAVLDDGMIGFFDCPSSPQEISYIFKNLRLVDLAVVEQVHSMPGNKAGSMFNFGQNFGRWEQALADHNIPYQLVRPEKWMKALGLGPDKEARRLAALRLFPGSAANLSRKKDDGRADALLLTVYARRFILNIEPSSPLPPLSP